MVPQQETLPYRIMKLSFKFFILMSLGAIAAPQYSKAGPVVEEAIPQDIDWFVHVDMEKLHETRTGQAFHAEFRDLIPAGTGQDLPIDPLLVLDGLQGITVYGTMPDFNAEAFVPDAVVLLEGTGDLIQIFRGLVSGMQIEQPEAIVPVEGDSNGILSIMNGQIYGSFVDENRIVLSKALPGLQQFFDVYQGGGDRINLEERFAVYHRDDMKGIFFGAFVEGLSQFDELPVQARILKLTQAVSLQLGEEGDDLNLLVSLMTDQAQTATQVSEVLKGLIAVFTLTQNGNPDVLSLVETASVSLDDRTVTLTVSYPVDSAVEWAKVLALKAKLDMAARKAAEEQAAAEAEKAAAESEAATETDEPAG